MYSPRVIAQNLEREAQRLGFDPQYHSVDDVRRANSYLKNLTDDDGSLKRKLKPDEERWVANERVLCRVDFNYFTTRYVWVENEESKLVQFQPRIPQRILDDVYADFEDQGLPIFIQQNKARQLGVTLDTELRIAH